MTTVPAPVPYPPAGGHSRRRWLKGAVALLLLLAVAWVSVIAAQYLRTGKPIADIPVVPQPIAKIVLEPPRFASVVDGVSAPIGVATAADGTAYTTESEGSRVIRAFDSTGAALGTFALPAVEGVTRVPAYVAVSPKGEVLVSDRGAGDVSRFSRDGQFLGTVPVPDGGWHPLGLAFDPAGNLYVTDVTPDHHKVVVLGPDYQVRTAVGEGQLFFPNSLAVDGNGRIWVADSNNGRVLAFDGSGAVVATISRSDAKSDLGMPRGMAIDPERKWLFVVDTTAHDVKVYDIGGTSPKYLYTLGQGEDAPAGGFAFPNGIAFDHGRLVITDRANDRLQVWKY